MCIVRARRGEPNGIEFAAIRGFIERLFPRTSLLSLSLRRCLSIHDVTTGTRRPPKKIWHGWYARIGSDMMGSIGSPPKTILRMGRPSVRDLCVEQNMMHTTSSAA